MAVLEDVQPVLPVPLPAQGILDRVRNVGMHLRRVVMIKWTIPRGPYGTYLDNFLGYIIIKEELANVCQLVRPKRAILQGIPLGKDLRVNVDRTARIVAWENCYVCVSFHKGK